MATATGQVIGYLFIVVGIWTLLTVSVFTGLWTAFIGWFLVSSAHAAAGQEELTARLRGVSVAQVMGPPPAAVVPELSLARLVDAYILPSGQRTVPVATGDRLVGLVTLKDIQRMPRERWEEESVGQVMTPIDRLHVARPTQQLAEVVPLLAANDVNQLPVMDDGRLVGMLSRDAVMRLLEVRRRLGVGDTPAEPRSPAASAG